MSEQLSAEQRAEIEARLQAATPGEWHTSPSDAMCAAGVHDKTGDMIVTVGHYSDQGQANRPQEDADADLIAHAPADLRALLDTLAAVEAERDLLRAVAEPIASGIVSFNSGRLGRPVCVWYGQYQPGGLSLPASNHDAHDPDCIVVRARAALAGEGKEG